MITELKIDGYKSLRKVDIKLPRLSVIVGPNSSGKTSLLKCIELIFRSVGRGSLLGKTEAGLADDVEGTLEVNNLITRESCRELRIEARTVDGLSIELFVPRPGPLNEINSSVLIDGVTRKQWDEAADAKRRDGLNDLAASSKMLFLEPDALRRPAFLDRPEGAMARDGLGLAAVVQRLVEDRDGTIESVEASLATLVTGAKKIRIRRGTATRSEKVANSVGGQSSFVDQVQTVAAATIEVWFDSQGWIPAENVSDGTIVLIGLLVATHASPNAVLLIDDIERGLHPLAQQTLLKYLMEQVRTKPELQVVATSHSPFILDGLEASQVFVTNSKDGDSNVRVLSDHPDWPRHQGYLRVGEFWSAVGEGWVIPAKS